MYQTSYQKSMTQLLEVLETQECQSRVFVYPVFKSERNNLDSRTCCLDYYNVQQEEQ